MRRKWKLGDRVTVVSFNKGLPRRFEPLGRKGTDKTEAWAGEIVGPSPIGPGWWNVGRIGPKGRRSSVFAVPAGEIRPRKR